MEREMVSDTSIEAALAQLLLLIEMYKRDTEGYVELPQRQLEVLMIVMIKGKQRITTLASMLGVTTPTVTGVTDRLVKGGLAKRLNDPQDRRVVLIAPTCKGEEVVLGPIVTFVAKMTEAEKESLYDIVDVLDRVRQRMV